MPLIIPPGYAQIVIPHKHAAHSRRALVTFGIDLAIGSPEPNVDAIVNAYDDAFGAMIDDSVTIGPGYAIVGQDGGENLVVSGTATESGSNAGDTMLNQGQALLIHKRTARGGRRGRGRMFLPWIVAESNVTDVGGIVSSGFTAYQTAATAFLTALNALADVENMVVLHTTGISAPGLPNGVSALVVDGLIGSQRRRLGR